MLLGVLDLTLSKPMIGQILQIRCPHLDDTNTDTRKTKVDGFSRHLAEKCEFEMVY